MNKTKIILRYLSVIIIIGIGQVFAILFPVAWLLKSLGKWNPLWFILDDSRLDKSRENGLAVDYEVYLNDFKWKPIGVFSWHVFRNRVWNLVELFKVPDGDPIVGNQRIEIVETVIDKLHKNDILNNFIIDQGGHYHQAAALKYIASPGEAIWQKNRGDVISRTTSIIGTGFIWYKVNDWYSFKYTSCNYNKFLKRWITLYIGTNTKRYSFVLKFSKNKSWAYQK